MVVIRGQEAMHRSGQLAAPRQGTFPLRLQTSRQNMAMGKALRASCSATRLYFVLFRNNNNRILLSSKQRNDCNALQSDALASVYIASSTFGGQGPCHPRQTLREAPQSLGPDLPPVVQPAVAPSLRSTAAQHAQHGRHTASGVAPRRVTIRRNLP